MTREERNDELCRVLLVEDNPGDADLVREGIERDPSRSVSLQVVGSLAAALAIIASGPLDFILLDLGLPDSSGVKTLESIRKAAPETPVVVLTGQNDPALGARCIEMGARNFLVKGRVETIISSAIHNAMSCAAALKATHDSHENLKQALECSADAILVLNEAGLIRFANRSARELFGGRIAAGQHFGLLQEGPQAQVLDVPQPNGSVAVVEMRTGETNWFGEPARIATFRDITEQAKAERELREHSQRLNYIAHHDALTGLSNRSLFQDRLGHAVQRAVRAKLRFALLYLDLDRFKNVNDSLGHEVGDELLRETAIRIRNILRESDTIARLGGDEFAIILENVPNLSDIHVLAQRVVDAVSEPFLIGGHEVFVGASIGVSVFPDDGIDAQQMLRNADAAMYQAKQTGGRHQFFTQDLNTQLRARFLLEANLRHAIKRGEMHVVYQPQYTLADGLLHGVEALARWNHPELGEVPPSSFIPLAEETGLIGQIGNWVLETTLGDFRHWQRADIAPKIVAVNLSPRQFRSVGLADGIAARLAAAGVATHHLELELTETTLLADSKEVAAALHALDRMGVRIAIDDFGTGYSSLSYLTRMPLKRLKIDRSFVRDLGSDPHAAAIVQAVIGLAHSLGLSALAEGVETAEQAKFLQFHGCDEVQGFLYGRPMREEPMRVFLRDYLREVA